MIGKGCKRQGDSEMRMKGVIHIVIEACDPVKVERERERERDRERERKEGHHTHSVQRADQADVPGEMSALKCLVQENVCE